MNKRAQSADARILDRMRDHGPGWVFTPAEFADLGSRNAVASALKRMKASKAIRQLARGIYDCPRKDPVLGWLSPSIDDIAQALKGRDNCRLQASGGHAASLLGISDQVPMKTVFLTDGRPRNVQIGRRQIVLKHTTTRNMATAGRISGTAIQALRWLGRRHVDDSVVAVLSLHLSDSDKREILNDLRYAPAWIADILRTVARKASK